MDSEQEWNLPFLHSFVWLEEWSSFIFCLVPSTPFYVCHAPPLSLPSPSFLPKRSCRCACRRGLREASLASRSASCAAALLACLLRCCLPLACAPRVTAYRRRGLHTPAASSARPPLYPRRGLRAALVHCAAEFVSPPPKLVRRSPIHRAVAQIEVASPDSPPFTVGAGAWARRCSRGWSRGPRGEGRREMGGDGVELEQGTVRLQLLR